MKKISFLEKYLNELQDYLGEETYTADFNSGTINPEDDMKTTTGTSNSDSYIGTKKNNENRQKIIENIIKGINNLNGIITSINKDAGKKFESITDFNNFLKENGIQASNTSIEGKDHETVIKDLMDSINAVKEELGNNDLASVLKAANESAEDTSTNENNKEQTSETSAPNNNEVASDKTTATQSPTPLATTSAPTQAPAASNNKV